MLDIRELMNLKEAYAEVYAPQELTEEQVWEEVETWVNDLIEEGYDLSDYTWEEMFEAYLEEQGGRSSSTASQTNQSVSGAQIGSAVRSAGNVLAYGNAQGTRSSTLSQPTNRRGGSTSTSAAKPTATPAPSGANSGQFGRYVPGSQQVKTPTATTPAKPTATPAAAKPTPTATRPAATAPAAPRPGAPARPAATAPAASASRPAAATPTRPAASSPAPKPAAATTPAAKPSAMDQFAKANPKLAAASAERARTRGTSATTNPLMKDMKSRLPAPKTPSPTTAKTGFDLAKKGVNLASGFDMFNVVKGYLIGEGYADTEEAALAIMTNMSEEWKQSIIKSI